MTTKPQRLTIIADDLTGAADTGAPFAALGFPTAIVLGKTPPSADVLVVTTNSRDMTVDAAAHANRTAVRQWVTPASAGGRGWVYKKIDSALRGHPAAEIDAVMTALGVRQVLVAPALPHEGRTTVGGRQFLDGVPLEQSGFGDLDIDSDVIGLFNADRCGRATSLGLETVRKGSHAIGAFLAESTASIIVADAETGPDLDSLARALIHSGISLVAGTAGFARHLAQVLPGARHSPPDGPYQPAGGVLIIAGSRHEATERQVEHLRNHGLPVVSLADHHLANQAALRQEVIAPLASALRVGTAIALTTTTLHAPAHDPLHIRQHLGAIVAGLNASVALGGLVLTGGDVAMGVIQALEATAVELGGEIRPALPWGIARLPTGDRLPVATKAGSFGTEDALLACLGFLQGPSPTT